MREKAFLTSLLLIIAAIIKAQHPVTGVLKDSTDHKNMQFAVVSLLKPTDTTLVAYTRAGKDGSFRFAAIDTGRYILLVTYPGFADYSDVLQVKSGLNTGDIFLTPKSKLLDEVIVRSGSAIRIKGDTTEFTADSFHVKQGATVEDLLKKLPGFSVNSKGEIVAQGKRVDKVLVDGEEFFGDDPTMATQNISAKAVEKVQVFDTKSEQQNLTGVTTGNEGKTVNIKLKEDAKKGGFGKIYAGTDFSKYYDTKALYNRFVGKKKVSVYGTRTNVNTGSLNWEEKQKAGIENDMEYDEIGGYYYSFNSGDEFSDFGLRGLPDAWTTGALFSNKWNEDKQNVNFSYRYNRLSTVNNGSTITQNILPSGVTYSNRYTKRNSLTEQHALNGKYEWKLDSLTSIKAVTAYTYKPGRSNGYNNSEFIRSGLDTANQSFNNFSGSNKHTQSDNQVTVRRLFKKKNRVWQTVFRYGIIDDNNDGLNYTRIRYFDNNGVYNYSDTVDQQKLFDGHSVTYGVKTTFTEPLSTRWMLVLDYGYNKNASRSLRNTFEKAGNDKYEVLVSEFSNNFQLDAFSHSGNATFRYTGKKMRAGIGSGISGVKLGLNNLDNRTRNSYHFFNITPSANINFTPKPQFNIGINYRGNSVQPTINQLQPLKDNTDPLNEYKGNPDLKVGFNHGMTVFINQYKTLSQRWIGFNLSYNIQQNAITQFNTVDITTGKRTYYPVNVNGNQSWFMWGQYNKSEGNKKPNYGFNINGRGNRYINYVNGEKALTRSFGINLGLEFGITSEDKYDFSINPKIGYNRSVSSLSQAVNNNYINYGGIADLSVTLPWKMEISTNLNADLRQRTQAFSANTNIITWNGGISKKVFKKSGGKLSFYANDILNQSKGFIRNISSTFISDDRYDKLSRYFLLKFEWSFTKAPGGNQK